MNSFLLEDNVKQPHQTLFTYTKEGMGIIINRKVISNETQTVMKVKETGKVYLNSETTDKLRDAFMREKVWTFTPANVFTRLLDKLGLLRIDIKYEFKEIEQ